MTFVTFLLYNMAMELPYICTNCNHENWVDPDSLESRPLDKLITADVYICEKCGSVEAVWYNTLSLQSATTRLTGNKLPFYFAKVMKKAQGVNERGEKLWRALTSKPGCP